MNSRMELIRGSLSAKQEEVEMIKIHTRLYRATGVAIAVLAITLVPLLDANGGGAS